MSDKTIQILMIDDDADDALLIRKLLHAAPPGSQYQVEWASTNEDGLARLCEGLHDICLLDYNLGARTGLELLGEAHEQGCFTPDIVLTGLGA